MAFILGDELGYMSGALVMRPVSKVSEQPCTRRNIRCWVACEICEEIS